MTVEFPVIVPDQQTVAAVMADGRAAFRLRTVKMPGADFSVEYYSAEISRPFPISIVTYFEPAR